MSRLTRFTLALLLTLFAFNQVVLPHVLSAHSKIGVCDPLEIEVEQNNIGQVLKPLKWGQPDLYQFICLLVPFFATHYDGDRAVLTYHHRTSPHGFHVPIYLDDRVLIV
jgi:hypothetical protein